MPRFSAGLSTDHFLIAHPTSSSPLEGSCMFSAVTAQIDIREMAPRNRHALISEAFDALKAGGALELLNDHDPAPLRQQLV